MWGESVARESSGEICPLVRDEQTGRFLYKAEALQGLGINPAEAQQRGYPIREQSALVEAAKDLTTDQPRMQVLLCWAQILFAGQACLLLDPPQV
jgi:hypothetical protein